jgi:peptidoglycan/LPS O-acetylase OafA/YrhL
MIKMGRFKGIDGLRGIAALGVAWFHTYCQNGGNLVATAMPTEFNIFSVYGRFGVQLFFVISGFVVAYTLYPDRSVNSLRAIGLYFARRSVRLDPTYWVALTSYAVCIPLLLHLAPLDIYPDRHGSAQEISKNVLYFLPVGGQLYIPVAWTLIIEVQFYLFFALIVFVINAIAERGGDRAKAFQFIVFAMIVLSTLKLTGIWAPKGPWLYDHIHTFLGGICAALVILRVPGAIIMFALSTASMVLVFVTNRDSYVLASLFSMLLVYLSVAWLPLKRTLSTPLLLLLGKLSYCVYLFHQLIGGIVIHSLQNWVSNSSGIHQVGFVLIGGLATIVVSAVVYTTIEKPSIEASKRFRSS